MDAGEIKKRSDVEGYVPQVFWVDGDRGYGLVLVQIDRCPTCGRWMVDRDRPWPGWYAINFDAQMRQIGWRESTSVGGDRGTICSRCKEEGRATFTCKSCGTVRTVDQVQTQFGDPPDFLCKTCYETVFAKRWNKLVNALEKKHRYDLE